jgi:hypothetical protein
MMLERTEKYSTITVSQTYVETLKESSLMTSRPGKLWIDREMPEIEKVRDKLEVGDYIQRESMMSGTVDNYSFTVDEFLNLVYPDTTDMTKSGTAVIDKVTCDVYKSEGLEVYLIPSSGIVKKAVKDGIPYGFSTSLDTSKTKDQQTVSAGSFVMIKNLSDSADLKETETITVKSVTDNTVLTYREESISEKKDTYVVAITEDGYSYSDDGALKTDLNGSFFRSLALMSDVESYVLDQEKYTISNLETFKADATFETYKGEKTGYVHTYTFHAVTKNDNPVSAELRVDVYESNGIVYKIKFDTSYYKSGALVNTKQTLDLKVLTLFDAHAPPLPNGVDKVLLQQQDPVTYA